MRHEDHMTVRVGPHHVGRPPHGRQRQVDLDVEDQEVEAAAVKSW